MIVTITELARIWGVTRNTINNWLNEGCPYVEKGVRGKQQYTFETVDVMDWREKRAIHKTTGSKNAMTKEEAQRRKLEAEAGLAELELAKKNGDVIELDEIERNLSNDYAKFRSAALKLPERCVIRLVGETDEDKIKSVIREEMLSALEVMEYVKGFAEEAE